MRSVSRLLTWRASLLILAVIAIAVIGGLALAWRSAIAPISPPAASTFPAEVVARGAALAKIGDCAICHTSEGGRPLSGGRPLATPFGTLYATNLTPDAATGLGRWSVAAFRRAMRDGVRRDGAHLYPALPYEHFTHATDGDLDALYAFLMTRDPVDAPPRANRLIPPLGFRPLLAGWKLLFLHRGPLTPDRSRTLEWNRGAYLAEGLGHCGACHSPRNLAGAESRNRAYGGGAAEGWRAPPLDLHNPAARAWTVDALDHYLTTGVSPDHSAAGGPMGPVTESLSAAPAEDVHAIAVYIASHLAATSASRPLALNEAARAQASQPQGAILFEGACAACHAAGAPMLSQGRSALGLATALADGDPSSAAQAVLRGVQPPVAGRGPLMPGFADALTDPQVSQVLAYARARFTDQPPWRRLDRRIRQARKESAQP